MISSYRYLITVLLLVSLSSGLVALKKGSKIRVELKNGSIIIGTVVRTERYTAWIRTRYGIFTVGYGTIKTTKVISPPPPVRKTNRRPPVRPAKRSPEWSAGIVLGLQPAGGESGSELNTGFDAGALLLYRTGALAPGIRLSYQRHTADSVPDGTLSLLHADALIRFYFLDIKRTGLHAEVSTGFTFARASLPDLSAQGFRFRFGFRVGLDIRLSRSLTLSPGGGLLMTLETGANLVTFPLHLETRLKL